MLLKACITEAAYIDGAGHIRTLLKIVLPLCLISLFIILWNWNDYFSGMVYIRSQSLKPLQTYLRSIILVNDGVLDSADLDSIMANLSSDATNGAKIFLGLLPIMALYPFLQKYFAKGIVRGSVKE